MNRRLAILFGVIVAAGAAVTVGVVQSQRGRAGTPKQTRVFDRRCRGGCSVDASFFQILPGGGSPSQTGSGTLVNSKGATVAFSRASSRNCTKADGTIVVLTNNQPCVEAAGLSQERETTNLALDSETLDQVSSWQVGGAGGASSPVVTANAATSPRGDVTADRVDVAAVGAGQTSYLYQNISAAPAGVYTYSVYLKGVSGPGTTFMFTQGSPSSYATCTFTAAGWTRCSGTVTTVSTGFYVILGANNAGGTPTAAAASFYAWGVDVENLSYPSSYVGPTTTASVSRAYDYPATYGVVALSNTSGCITECITPEFSGPAIPAESTNSIYPFFRSEGGAQFILAGAGNTDIVSNDGVTSWAVAANFQQGVKKCYSTEWTAGTRVMRNLWSGVTSYITGGFANSFSSATLQGGLTQAWVSDISAGSAPGKCPVPQSSSFVRMVALGDSITYGTGIGGVSVAYPTQLNNLLGSSYFVTNAGIGGNTTTQMLARWTAQSAVTGYGPISLAGNTTLILMGGTNDALTAVAAATAYANLAAILDDAHAKGIKTVSLTVLPCGGGASCDATAQTAVSTINSSLASYVAAHPTNSLLVDSNALLRNSGSPNQLAGAYDSGDHIHPNQAALNAIATAVKAVVPF